ncbi:DUF7322 domain-containing protein [Salinilacihabitans rarus]|uniref:DUF7322 domain-containing protein n=1 Tax=Salinilacihabitans rarus TaxID=2961596 RepID=UPI0020C8A930|nr:hypothetical protein [Salinilacihabitans rarus]
MDFEPSEHEPDEYDPEAELRDPESDTITIPEVSTDETDVSGDLLTEFWALVLVVNAALLATSLGALFLVFEADLYTGGGLLAGGLVLFGFAIRRYRSFETPDDGENDGDAGGDSTETHSNDERQPPSPDETGSDG